MLAAPRPRPVIPVALPSRVQGIVRACFAPTMLALADQGLVSGFGFLAGIVTARLVDLASFGRFALVIIFTGFAQNLHNALITSPMMTLVGRRSRTSHAYNASVLGVAALAALAAGLLVAVLIAGFFALRGDLPSMRFLIATAVLTASQNVILTVRRLLFACSKGLLATIMDALRVLAFLGTLLALRAAGVEMTVTLLIEILAATALATGMPFLWAFRPRRRGSLQLRAVARRHVPLARWLLPVVFVTFGQEQLVWIVAGILLGDHAVGGLRAAQYLVGFLLLLLTATENVVPVGAARALAAAGRPGLNRYLLSTGAKLGLLLAVPGLVVALAAGFWLKLVFGDAFVPFAGCLRILVLAALFVHVRDMATQYFRATMQTGVIFKAFAFSLVMSLLSLYPLLAGAGLIGAAIVVLVGHATSMCTMLLAASADSRRLEQASGLGRVALRGTSL